MVTRTARCWWRGQPSMARMPLNGRVQASREGRGAGKSAETERRCHGKAAVRSSGWNGRSERLNSFRHCRDPRRAHSSVPPPPVGSSTSTGNDASTARSRNGPEAVADAMSFPGRTAGRAATGFPACSASSASFRCRTWNQPACGGRYRCAARQAAVVPRPDRRSGDRECHPCRSQDCSTMQRQVSALPYMIPFAIECAPPETCGHG